MRSRANWTDVCRLVYQVRRVRKVLQVADSDLMDFKDLTDLTDLGGSINLAPRNLCHFVDEQNAIQVVDFVLRDYGIHLF